MKHQNFPNNDDENLSLEDEKIRQMISSLKRITAPKDFDFRLKARIANATSTDFQPRFLPVLRYVLPLSTILVIFAFVVLNGLYFPDNQAVSQFAEDVPQTQVEQNAAPITPVESSEKISIIAKDKTVAVEDLQIKPAQTQTRKDVKPQFIAVKSPTTTPKKNLPIKVKTDNGGGSRDEALTEPPINATPKNINLNPPNTETPKLLNAQEILSQLGIEAVFTDTGWKVKSVKQEVLGVKVGDVIEAIDGEKLTGKLLFAKTAAVKKLTVMRGTEKIEISLPTN